MLTLNSLRRSKNSLMDSVIEREILRNKGDKAAAEQATERYKAEFAESMKNTLGKELKYCLQEPIIYKRKKPFKLRFTEWLNNVKSILRTVFIGDDYSQ